MSSAANHRKRSHRSEFNKGSAFRAASRRAYYRTAPDRNNRSVFSRIANLFYRKALKSSPPKEVQP